jgi:hypothetical protein
MLMKNIVDYVTAPDLSFESRAFGPVDSLVLSQLAYLKFDEIVPGLSDDLPPVSIGEIAAAGNDSMFQNVRESKNNQQLLSALINSPRFQNIRLDSYTNQFDDKAEKQFSAVTFLLDDESAYIAFRGTDSTLVGWKEDFNMAFTSPVPSQRSGVDYLNSVANKVSGQLRVGGHSKGGNIAVYAAIYCDESVQKRIEQVFSHDGPGFRDEVFHSDAYQSLKGRIHKTLPQSSMIGMLLQDLDQYSVVKSDRFWLMQHDPFSWRIDGDDFHYSSSITKGAGYMDKALNQWLNSLDDQKRELFVNALFQVLEATEASTIHDLIGDWPKKAIAALSAIKEMDDDTRMFLSRTIQSLFVLTVRNIRESDPEK